MMESVQVSDIIREIMDLTGMKQAAFAKKIGVGQGTVSKWINNEQIPNLKQWQPVVLLIRKDPRLRSLRDRLNPPRAIPVVGRVGAGAAIDPDFDQAAPEGLFDVTLPFDLPDELIGLEVDGDSMLPKYEPGDVIVVRREQRERTDAYVGQLVAVRTKDGRRYLKTMLRGSAPDLYRLQSFNARPIDDVEIEWVGEIYVTVSARQVNRVVARKSPPKRTVEKSRSART